MWQCPCWAPPIASSDLKSDILSIYRSRIRATERSIVDGRDLIVTSSHAAFDQRRPAGTGVPMTETPTVVGGPFDGTVVPSLGGHEIEGLELESTNVWGLFRTRGDEPHIVQVMRRLSQVEAWPPRLLLQSNFGVAGMRRHRIELMAARARDVESCATGSGWRFTADAHEGAQPFELSIEHGSARWAEGQILDVSGEEVTPGLQWCLVPDAGGEGMRYASQIFKIEGTFEGIEVDGFLGVDQVHLASGPAALRRRPDDRLPPQRRMVHLGDGLRRWFDRMWARLVRCRRFRVRAASIRPRHARRRTCHR